MIRDCDFKPIFKFNKTKRERKPLYLGFELEIEADEYASDDFDTDYSYCKEDGSVCEGFEVVTHPMTLSYIKEEDILKDIWRKCLDNRVDSSYHGFHVHINRDFLNYQQKRKLAFLSNKLKDFLYSISRRYSLEDMNEWAKFSIYSLDWYNSDRSFSNARYRALNFTNGNTIEFRFFGSTIKYKELNASLEIVDAMVRFVKKYSINHYKTKGKAISNFIKYIEKNQNKYPYSIEYIKSKVNIDRYLTEREEQLVCV